MHCIITINKNLGTISVIAITVQGEGCSYRGRVLLELTVKTGRYPSREEYVQDVSNDDLFAIQQFLRRRKYRLFVGFLEASMINPVDGPIEFEVSIGIAY